MEADDYRPISILPCLSKVYERLVLSQLVSYIERLQVYSDNIARYRKGHCTTTVLMRITDDLINAMKKGEVTLIAFADFSKAFDTVDYSVIIRKLHNFGFSKLASRRSLSYLTDWQQFVQVNDKQSQFMDVQFGVPQGSILDRFFSTFMSTTCEIAFKTASTATNMQTIRQSTSTATKVPQDMYFKHE